jgi:hypothetical protein
MRVLSLARSLQLFRERLCDLWCYHMEYAKGIRFLESI